MKDELFRKIEDNFRELIIERCKFCQFDQYLEEDPGFEFPRITEDLLGADKQDFIMIPGMFGGFAYYVDGVTLYAEQSSRMDYSSDDYSYFEVTEEGYVTLEGEARENVAKKFRELSKKAFEEREQRLRG